MQFLRIQDVVTKMTIKKSEIWDRVSAKTFPEPISISPRITVWDLDELEIWMQFKKELSRKNTIQKQKIDEAELWKAYLNENLKNKEKPPP